MLCSSNTDKREKLISIYLQLWSSHILWNIVDIRPLENNKQWSGLKPCTLCFYGPLLKHKALCRHPSIHWVWLFSTLLAFTLVVTRDLWNCTHAAYFFHNAGSKIGPYKRHHCLALPYCGNYSSDWSEHKHYPGVLSCSILTALI